MTGAYKERGALAKLTRLGPEERGRGLIAASAGTHAQAVNQFAAQPAGHGTERQAHQFHDKGRGVRRVVRGAAAQVGSQREQDDQHDVPGAMRQTDSLGPRAARDVQPVPETEHGSQEPADDAGQSVSASLCWLRL